MSAPSIVRRHPALRWLIPVGVLGVLGLTGGSLLRTQSATDGLPHRSAAELVAEVRAAATGPGAGYSGTVIAQLSLGLPVAEALSADDAAAAAGPTELPTATPSAFDPVLDPANGVTDLLTGPHTMRYWYGGPDRQRVALLQPTDEADVFYSGHDVWLWDSTARVATHATVDRPTDAPLSAAALVPQQLAARALAAADPGTDVTVGGSGRVADRTTYELVVTPADPGTRVASVHIDVDGVTKVPLAVRVYARGQDAPAVDVAFAAVSFRRPAASLFHFAPPADATVVDGRAPDVLGAVAEGAVRAATMGGGWSAVVRVPAAAAVPSARSAQSVGSPPRSSGRSSARSAVGEVAALPAFRRVHGAWGSGRVVECALLSALVTDDGRVFVGAVDPAALYRAAGR